MFWTRPSTIGGTGTTRIAAGGQLQILETVGTLDGQKLENFGDAVIVSGPSVATALHLTRGAVLDNYGTFDLQADQSNVHINLPNGGSPGGEKINNFGTFVKSGANNSEVLIPFDNDGTVQVDQARLILGRGGVSTGSFVGAAGTTLRFGGGLTTTTTVLTASSSIVSEGIVQLSGKGSMTVEGFYDVKGGTIASVGVLRFAATSNVVDVGSAVKVLGNGVVDFGSRDLTVANGFAISNVVVEGAGGTLLSVDLDTVRLLMNGGTIGGAGTTNIATGGSFTIIGKPAIGNTNVFDGRTVNNFGNAEWLVGGQVSFRDGAVFNNYGTLDIQGDGSWAGFGSGTFNNFGTLVKSVGDAVVQLGDKLMTSTTFILGTFNNHVDGLVDVQQGALQFAGGGTSSGSFTGAANTALLFTAGTHVLDEFSSVDTAGAVLTVWPSSANSANVTFEGSFSVGSYVYVGPGDTSFTGISFPNNTVPVGDLLIVERGTVRFGARSINTTTIKVLNGGFLNSTGDLNADVLFWDGWLNGQNLRTVTTSLDIDGGTLNLGVLDNLGEATWFGSDLDFRNGAVLNNLGTFDATADHTLNGDGAVNNSGLFLKSAGAGSTSILVPFSNDGTVDAQSGTIHFTNFLQQAPTVGGDPETLLNGGALSSSSPLDFQDGVLAGGGLVNASVANSARVSPGLAPGDLGVISITGDYVQSTDGTLQLEIGGSSPGNNLDQLAVTGKVLLSGQLQVSLISGFVPDGSETFVLIDNDGTDDIVGTFAGLPEGALVTLGGQQYRISYVGVDETGNDVILAAVNQPPIVDDQSFDVVENGTAVGTVAASDPDLPDDTLAYSISGGPDAGLFTVNSATGELSFLSAPDFETPLDDGADNVYDLEVTVTDSNGAADVGDMTINLLNQASITGAVFVDVNENGLYDANEPGIDGVAIELHDATGTSVLDTVFSSDGGFYLFEDLDPDTYQVHEIQPTGVEDGAEILGSLGGSIVANDTMQLTLDRTDASDYVFAELGQEVSSGDTATIGFWQNKHGQALIDAGGDGLASWLSTNFANVFDSTSVADFYKQELFKQKAKMSAGPARVDAQFMATAMATYFTSSNLAGIVAADYGFNVTDTGIGTKVVNVGTSGDAFSVADGTNLTILQLLLATNALTDDPDDILGAANIYDTNGDGVIDATEAALRAMANDIYTFINEGGN